MRRVLQVVVFGTIILLSSYYLLIVLGLIRHYTGADTAGATAGEELTRSHYVSSTPEVTPLQAVPLSPASFPKAGNTHDKGNRSSPPPLLGDAVITTPYPAAIYSNQVYLPLVTEKNQGAINRYSFLETFDGMPLSPQPWNPASWDVTVHSRDVSTFYQPDPMNADHGTDCTPPPATHSITSYEDSVFVCHDHMMTAINAGGYGVIYLTPNQQVDFSNGEAVIRWDMSTARKSSRDWVDLWITPFADNLQLPLQSWLPDLDGPPRRSIHIFMDNFNGGTVFKAELYRDFNSQSLDGNSWTTYETFLTPSQTRRDTFELHISRTHLKFGMPAYDFWWVNTDIPALDWSQGIVQFGHHSYNPGKACNFDGTCGPNTWHWDNVYISPATTFTIFRANQRHVDPTTPPDITLPAPAPTNAFLRFAGVGPHIEVSFDGGQTWRSAQAPNQNEFIAEHFWSYWMPIPSGVSGLQIRGQDWYGGVWMVRDISVWSLQPPATQ